MDRTYNICLVIFVSLCTSCGEKTPAPDVAFTVTVTGNVASFSSEATNTDTYEWDFGDGSPLATEPDPVHTFPQYGKDYTVKLKATGRGGITIVTQTVSVPQMTVMEMLAGGDSNPDGVRWRLSTSAPVSFTKLDTLYTVIKDYPGGYLSSLGFASAYLDEYIFKNDGSFSIVLKGSGMIAGLGYCTANGIPNIVPGEAAREANLTLMTPYEAPSGLSFGLNEGRQLRIQKGGGKDEREVIFRKVMTLTFSYGASIGIRDWMNEVIIREMSESRITLASFISGDASGKPTGMIIFSLDAAR